MFQAEKKESDRQSRTTAGCDCRKCDDLVAGYPLERNYVVALTCSGRRVTILVVKPPTPFWGAAHTWQPQAAGWSRRFESTRARGLGQARRAV